MFSATNSEQLITHNKSCCRCVHKRMLPTTAAAVASQRPLTFQVRKVFRSLPNLDALSECAGRHHGRTASGFTSGRNGGVLTATTPRDLSIAPLQPRPIHLAGARAELVVNGNGLLLRLRNEASDLAAASFTLSLTLSLSLSLSGTQSDADVQLRRVHKADAQRTISRMLASLMSVNRNGCETCSRQNQPPQLRNERIVTAKLGPSEEALSPSIAVCIEASRLPDTVDCGPSKIRTPVLDAFETVGRTQLDAK